MSNGVFLLALVAAAFTCSSASAATITTTASKENKTIVLLNGEIAAGGADTLKEIIKSANDSGRWFPACASTRWAATCSKV